MSQFKSFQPSSQQHYNYKQQISRARGYQRNNGVISYNENNQDIHSNRSSSIDSSNSSSSGQFGSRNSNKLGATADFANRFNPLKNIPDAVAKFQMVFFKLLNNCINKVSLSLLHQCQHQYQFLKQILDHRKQHASSPYFNVMHENSTQTKIHLLNMLGLEQQKLKARQNELIEVYKEIGDKNNEIQQISNAIQGRENKLKQQIKKCNKYMQKADKLEAQVSDLKQQYEKIHQEQDKIKEELDIKKFEIKQLICAVEKLNKQLNQKKEQEQKQKFTIKQNEPLSSTPRKIKQPKSFFNTGISIPSTQNSIQQKRIHEDLFRMLFVQATTIQQNLQLQYST